MLSYPFSITVYSALISRFLFQRLYQYSFYYFYVYLYRRIVFFIICLLYSAPIFLIHISAVISYSLSSLLSSYFLYIPSFLYISAFILILRIYFFSFYSFQISTVDLLTEPQTYKPPNDSTLND